MAAYEAGGTVVDRHRLTPACFRRPMVHAVAPRAKASVNRPPRPGEKGWDRRKGSRAKRRVVPPLIIGDTRIDEVYALDAEWP